MNGERYAVLSLDEPIINYQKPLMRFETLIRSGLNL